MNTMNRIKKMAIGCLLAFFCGGASADPLGNGFTYQGNLVQSGFPASGSFDLTFNIYDGPNPDVDSQIAMLSRPGVTVTGGLFQVELDLGPGFFDGTEYWLEIEVAPAGGGPAEALDPLQKITRTPYAADADTLDGLDSATFQNRISGSCPAGESIRSVLANGSVDCEVDDLENHTATQNLSMGAFWISSDGDDEGLYVDPSGFVGVGNTAPRRELQVRGAILIDAPPDRNANIVFETDNGLISSIGLQDNFDQGFYVRTSDEYRLSVNLNGNVGIGTISADQKLHVNGAIQMDTLTAGDTNTHLCLSSSNVISSCASGLESLDAEPGRPTERLFAKLRDQQSQIEQLKAIACLDHPGAELCRP